MTKGVLSHSACIQANPSTRESPIYGNALNWYDY